jgi:hypothetical protein
MPMAQGGIEINRSPVHANRAGALRRVDRPHPCPFGFMDPGKLSSIMWRKAPSIMSAESAADTGS